MTEVDRALAPIGKAVWVILTQYGHHALAAAILAVIVINIVREMVL